MVDAGKKPQAEVERNGEETGWERKRGGKRSDLPSGDIVEDISNQARATISASWPATARLGRMVKEKFDAVAEQTPLRLMKFGPDAV
jgi:hypothetical protein